MAQSHTPSLAPLVMLAIALTVTMTSSQLLADESVPLAPVVVTMGGGAELRVQIAEGRTGPCDSSNNRMLFDGRLRPGASFRGAIAGDCICLRHTSASFREVDWSPSGMVCRPRICRGKICRPAPDPTIYVTVP